MRGSSAGTGTRAAGWTFWTAPRGSPGRTTWRGSNRERPRDRRFAPSTCSGTGLRGLELLAEKGRARQTQYSPSGQGPHGSLAGHSIRCTSSDEGALVHPGRRHGPGSGHRRQHDCVHPGQRGPVRGLPFDDPESIVAVWTENVQNQQSNVFPPELPGCATIRYRQNDCSNSKDESFHSIPLKSSSHAIHPSDTGTTHDVRYPLTPSSRTKATSVPCARKVFFWPNLDPSEPEQPIDLHDQTAVAKLRETVGVQRIRIPVLGIDHEDFAAGTILPAEPEIGAERVPTGAVL